MNRNLLSRILGKHGLLFGVVFVLVTAAFAVRAAHPPPTTPRATSSVVILPDPRTPISWSTPIIPPYQTFRTKFLSLSDHPVRVRAAELALGELPFLSHEWDVPVRRETIDAGRHLLRGEFGNGDAAVLALAEDLGTRLHTHHVDRRQIAEVTVEADSPLAARFLSWAVIEAAHQVHAERMVREVHAMQERVSREREAARTDLVDLWSNRETFPELERIRLELHRRLICGWTSELLAEESTVRLATVRNESGLPSAPPEGSAALASERGSLRARFLDERAAYFVRAALLGPLHPELREREVHLRALHARIEELDTRATDLEERIVAATLREDSTSISIARAGLEDRRSWLAEEIDAWNEAFAAHRFSLEESRRLSDRLLSLGDLANRLRWFEESLGSPVVVLGPASDIEHPERPVEPWVLILTSLIITVGSLSGFFIVRDRLGGGIRCRSDVEDGVDLPLLGVIPEERRLPLDLLEPTASPAAAALETLAATIDGPSGTRRLATLAIASAEPGEGKTTLSIRLAAALARRGLRVALVDGDLRRPRIAETLGLPPGPGLIPCLTEAEPSGDPVLAPTRIPGLRVLASTPLATDRLPIIDDRRFGALLARLRRDHDIVLIDTPAVFRTADALSIGRRVDGTLLVARSFATSRRSVVRTRGMLVDAGAILTGVVLTRFPHTPERAALAPAHDIVAALAASRAREDLVEA